MSDHPTTNENQDKTSYTHNIHAGVLLCQHTEVQCHKKTWYPNQSL